MNSKRSVVEEIENRNFRSNYLNKDGFLNRIEELENLIKQIRSSSLIENQEIIRYFPIATIAVTESFFRYVYKELIDSNDVFFEQGILHAKSLNNFKFDLDYLTALRGKKVTIGEIISHSIPLNNLTDINNTVSKLLKIDFLKEIKNFNYKEIWNLTDVSQFKSNIGKIILSVEDNFKTRHILAHEFALNINLDKEKIFLDFANHKNFLLAADFVVEKIAGSYIPWYQQGMNRTVFDKYSKSKEELDSLIALLKEINEKPDKFPILGDIYLFNKSLENWEKFRTSYAECFAEEVKGGSLYPTIYYSVMQKQTDYLIKNLYDEFQITLRKYEIENKNLTRSTK